MKHFWRNEQISPNKTNKNWNIFFFANKKYRLLLIQPLYSIVPKWPLSHGVGGGGIYETGSPLIRAFMSEIKLAETATERFIATVASFCLSKYGKPQKKSLR